MTYEASNLRLQGRFNLHATIHVERDTDYNPFQRLMMWIGMYLPNSIESWISSFLPESTYEVEVLISGDVTPVREGRFYGPPELCFPDEGGEVDITEISANGRLFELTEEETKLAIEALWMAANEKWEADEEDAAVARYESKMSFLDY